ncbi:MAG: CocE/NonD family hydrolase [Spirochaetes bacterium]|nr:CocE/NonD family hydrolase [Spirochaetota bacterium]
MRRIIAILLLLLLPAALAAQEAPPSKEMIEALEKALKTYSKDQKNLTRDDRSRLEAFVKEKYGATILASVKKILDRADGNHDGLLTLGEWAAYRKGATAIDPALCLKILVPMRDGVKLATYVTLPQTNGAHPVLLTRTPYRAGFAVRAGYVNIQQDMRGRFASEGENFPFNGCGWGEWQDGIDTLAWIRRQSWCDGKVGTYGASACGITQNLLAGAEPEGLRAQYIVVAAANLYEQAAYTGGALRKCQIENWLTGNKFDPKALALFAAHPLQDAFWLPYDSTTRFERMDLPAVHCGGWYDTFSQGTLDSFVGRQTRGKANARGNQRLVMGPWAHNGATRDGKCGELFYPDSALPPAYSEAKWFEYWLKGAENGVAGQKAVAYYVMGDTLAPGAPGNLWRFVDAWPPKSAETPYYLGGGRLTPSEAQPGAETFVFDPKDPCPTIGGRNLTIARGPMNQNPVEGRSDVLRYDSEPLAAPLEVTGRVRARIFISTTAKDTDVSVRLCDVHPDGKSFLVVDGMQRLRLHASTTNAVAIEAGKIYEAVVDLWSVSQIFNKGHRLRVSVTSANFPRYDVNPGTGLPWTAGGATLPQTNTIYASKACPSRILLPTPL